MAPLKRKQYGDAALTHAVERVVAGGERAAVVSREQRIPYRTLLMYVARRRRGEPTVPKRRGPPPALTAAGEQQLLRWMRDLQRSGLPVRRRELLVKANEVLRELSGPGAEVSTGWYGRFRDRHPEISGPGAELVIAEGPEAQGAPTEPETSQEPVQKQPARKEKQRPPCTPVERAIAQVQESYAETWPAQDVVDAYDVMLDAGKARMFTVMAAGELRDLWLRKQLRQVQ
ncbi:hypothetical protein BBJ28_00005017 [Nothophytophthora sp. Chile5]|nr:hypothetical protein BBJ28_00005017 [Nothophytophthora sp. Chile5]